MELNLKRPLIVFDLETTGLDLVNDRIIQISYIKVFPDGKEDRENLFVNPQKPIPQEVQVLTHITQSDVEGAPTFKELAPRLAETFRGCDFCGFNSNKFDVPMLSEEFSRAQVPFDFSESLLVDAQNIFHKMERRNLAAAYKFYTGHKMEDDFQSHRADQDAEATLRVLKGQLDMYAPGVQDEADRVLNNDIKELAEFSKMNDNVDFAGRIIGRSLPTPRARFADARCSTSASIVAKPSPTWCATIRASSPGCSPATSPTIRRTWSTAFACARLTKISRENRVEAAACQPLRPVCLS